MRWKTQGLALTEQLVRPAVERLAGRGVLVLLVVLDWPEVSQSSHEPSEVHLVLSANMKTVNGGDNINALDIGQSEEVEETQSSFQTLLKTVECFWQKTQ